MKKIISGVLVFCLLFCAHFVPANANNESNASLTGIFYQAVVECKSELDLSEYSFTTDDVSKAWDELFNKYADVYHLNGLNMSHINGVVKSVKFSYIYTKEQIEWVKDYAYENFLRYADKDWTDLEKVVFLHDSMCTKFQYDRRLFNPETKNNVGRDVYVMFSEGTGVCEAYAETFAYLGQKLGLEVKMVMSIDANHEWNLVKVEGKWYHIDVTQDDPLFVVDGEYLPLDFPAYVSRKYLLRSDSGIYDKQHFNWFCADGSNIKCTTEKLDTSYDFDEAESQYVYIDGYWYFLEVDGSKVEIERTSDFKQDDEILTFPARWEAESGFGYYPGCYSGLSSVGNWLIYNTDSNVMAVNVKTKENKKLFDVEQVKERTDIKGENIKDKNVHFFGIRTDCDKVFCQIATEPYSQFSGVSVGICEYEHLETGDWQTTKEPTDENEGKKEKFCIFGNQSVESEAIPATGVKSGDCSGDGKIDTTDLAMLKKGVAGLDIKANAAFDCNKDSRVDTTDLAILKKFIAGLIKALA